MCVSVPPDDSLMCAPEFTKQLKDLTVNDGDMLTLSCAIKGDPDPQVVWMKEGKVSAGEVFRKDRCRILLGFSRKQRKTAK